MSKLEQKHSFENRALKDYKLHALHNSYINIKEQIKNFCKKTKSASKSVNKDK